MIFFYKSPITRTNYCIIYRCMSLCQKSYNKRVMRPSYLYNSHSYAGINVCSWSHDNCIFMIGIPIYRIYSYCIFNSFAPGRCRHIFKIIIFKLISWTGISCTACEIAVRWIPWNSIDDKSTLVQVMAWCRQATSHYLSQCWPRSMSPYGVTRPQWVKGLPDPWLLCPLIRSPKLNQQPNILNNSTLIKS